MRFKHIKEEVSLKYSTKFIVCRNGYIKVRHYKEPLNKLKSGWELEDVAAIPLSENQERIKRLFPCDKDEVHEIEIRSLNRTKNTLIEYASENAAEFHSFITLTFGENISDIDEANKAFKTYISSCKRKWPDFKYLGVPEYQKRGAVHYHLLTSLRCGSDLKPRDPLKTYNKQKHKYFDLVYYDLPFWPYGFSSAFDVDLTDEKFNVALYMTKYLFKDIDNRLWGRKKILKSNSLRKPDYFLLANNAIYLHAMQYLKEKGYDLNSYQYLPEEKYITPYIQHTANITREDCNMIKSYLKQNDIKE